MPFKSEKQRKYLWANEPEIARDWTDTYGSGIKAAQGGRIGFRVGKGAGMEKTSDTGMPTTQSGAISSGADYGRTSHHPGVDTGHISTPVTVKQPDYRGNENLDRGGIRGFLNRTRSNIMPKLTKARTLRELKRRRANKIDSEEDLWESQTGKPHLDYREKDINRITELQDYFDGGKGNFNLTQDQYYDIFPSDKPVVDTGGGGEGGQIPWWLRQQAPVASTDTATASTGLGEGHFQVPLEYVVGGVRAADGGRIGFFKGAQADARAGKASMSPGTHHGGGSRGGGDNVQQGGEGQVAAGFFEPKVLQPGLDRSKANVDRKKAILSGAITDPDDPSTWNFAEGGLIGSVGGISRPKYQQGNMVGAEMEGAEMEGAVMQSQEVIKELYDALIAQGLSPQEAMEKIREMIASSQTQEPQSPMMGEEFPGQEFGRAPAAFGGIMDTYTGRRKYGLGSILKKATRKIKKLAGSKLGKLALMYAAGTYLGGTTAFGGAGTQTFAQRLADPKLLANLLNPTGGGIGEGKGWSIFQKAAPAVTSGNQYSPFLEAGYNKNLSTLAGGAKNLTKAAAKTPWYKNPWVTIPAIGAATGLYTAAQPEEDLDDAGGEWQKQKDKFDAYLASLDTGDSYRVPSQYTLAQGGRIGYDNGGISSMMASASDPLDDKNQISLSIFGKPLHELNPEEEMQLDDWLEDKAQKWGGAIGGRVAAQEGGLMNLGGMEKDYRNDGGFVPIGGEEKADDVPARLSRNEFVFTADAVRNAGDGDIDRGAEVMENVMKNLEAGGKVSEESQGQGAQEMFEVSERLSEVI